MSDDAEATMSMTRQAQSGADGWSTQQCFGGAISVRLPSEFVNVSDVRQVPDNQEVFVDDTTGASVIVELLERVDDVDDANAARYHFDELARSNRATAHCVDVLADPTPAERGAFNQLLFGKQRVAKFNETGRENDVTVVLGLRRIPPPVATDVLLSVCYAHSVAAGSSDDKNWDVRLRPQQLWDMCARAFATLVINDYSLFVCAQ